jgi:hypothetical protein
MKHKTFQNLKLMTLLGVLTLVNTSCSCAGLAITYSPLKYQVAVQKGTGAYVMFPYYGELDEGYLSFKESDEVENSFTSGDYKIIICDTLLGLKAASQSGKYSYYGSLSSGNQKLIHLKSSSELKELDSYNIISNNEDGVLGQTLKYIDTYDDTIQVSFVEMNDNDFYEALYSGTISKEDYDMAFIADPFAARLFMQPESKLYDSYVAGENNEHVAYYETYLDRYFNQANKLEGAYLNNLDSLTEEQQERKLILSDFTKNYSDDNPYISSTSIFVHNDYYESNKDDVNELFTVLNYNIPKLCINNVTFTQYYVYLLSEDETEQFNKAGFGYQDIAKCQAWDTVANAEAKLNRLRYTTSLNVISNDNLIKWLDLIGFEDYDAKSVGLE